MMDERRKAEARARYAGMETRLLETMWVREERVEWAEAALYEELRSRGTDIENLAGRNAAPVHAQPEWLKPLDTAPKPGPGPGVSADNVERPLPLALFIPVFVGLLTWTIGMLVLGVTDHSMTAATRRVILPLMFFAIGGFSAFGISRIGFRRTFLSRWTFGLLVGTVIWVARPTVSVEQPSLMLQADASSPRAPSIDELQRGAVNRAIAALNEWSEKSQALDKESAGDDSETAWEPGTYQTAFERDSLAESLITWRSHVAAYLSGYAFLEDALDRADRSLPDELRTRFRELVVLPARSFVDAEKVRLGIRRKRFALVERLLALGGRQPPVMAAAGDVVRFQGEAAHAFAEILRERDALEKEEDLATIDSNEAYTHFVAASKPVLGMLE